MAGASVFLYPVEKGTITDEQGRYSINGLSNGSYTIVVSFIGYRTLTDSIEIERDRSLNFRLSVASINLQEVVIYQIIMPEHDKEKNHSILRL